MNQKSLGIILGVILAGALLSIWLTNRTPTIQISKEEFCGVQTGLGQTLAGAVTKISPEPSRVVVVTSFQPDSFKKYSKYLWPAFATELKKQKLEATIVTVPGNAWNSGDTPADQAAFKGLLEQYRKTDVLILFVDLPEWGRVAQALADYSGPTILAVDHQAERLKPHYGGYFSSGILAALIGPSTRPVPQVQPKTPREWFDRNYQVYTPQNFETLPE